VCLYAEGEAGGLAPPLPSTTFVPGIEADRSQFYKDLTLRFYGYNRPNAKVSGGGRDSCWL
jgi:hypothetical protein